jgi:hypothetical protein
MLHERYRQGSMPYVVRQDPAIGVNTAVPTEMRMHQNDMEMRIVE